MAILESQQRTERDVQVWSDQELRRVTRLCAVLTGDPAVADDLAQETLLQAWRIRDRLVDDTGAGPWIDAVARNVCRRWRVAHARRAAHEALVDAPPEEIAPEDHHDELLSRFEQEDLARLLERALSRLPEPTRALLLARYVDERPPAQIAEQLAVSPESVGMRLLRGRTRLRRVLEGELAHDPVVQECIDRNGVGWRATRVRCTLCGEGALQLRRDDRRGVLEVRCRRCDPDAVTSAWRLDNPTWSPLLEGARRPSALMARMTTWAHDWWPRAIRAGGSPCTRCGAEVVPVAYVRSELVDPGRDRGWQARCARCQEETTTSLVGLSLAEPRVRSLRQHHPGARVEATREVMRDGRVALAVTVADAGSGAAVEVLYDNATSHPLGVVLSR